jgi:glutamate synthase (NADPH/NADH) small chain
MNEITKKEKLASDIYSVWVRVPKIAARRKAGQFVIIRTDEQGERIPLTIADSDPEDGTIRLVYLAVGEGTRRLAALEVGDSIANVAGPLGRPTHIERYGRCVVIGGGVGVAAAYPIAKALKEAGNHMISVISARRKDLLIMREEMGEISDEVYYTTDDGSEGFHGFPTQLLQEWIDEGKGIDLVLAVGPAAMMGAVVEVAKRHDIKIVVSLNSIMVDGTGMCGSCRVTVGGETKFTCVDGPEFDGAEVDFKELLARLGAYDKGARPERCEGGVCASCKVEAVRGTGKSPPRQEMAELEPGGRASIFDEVPRGYTPEQARLEASRCLQCKDPKCMAGCPVGVDIPGFIKLVAEGDFAGAARKLKMTNALPAICGRVCPQEEHCEAVCVLARSGEAVAIGNLERFVADYEREAGEVEAPPAPEPTGYRVAVIGSGPAGLTAAGELAKMGHSVTIFEALHKPGGVLVYGIPEFRLPKSIVEEEVDYLRKVGVKIELDYVVGKLETVDELLEQGFDAVFVGTGAGLPKFLGIPGENLVGVYSANEYLTRANLMKAYHPEYRSPIVIRDRVNVIGGGNVAMDSARTALRLGAKEVTVVYRRSRDEMPARKEEIRHAEEEGIQFQFLTNPVEILGDDEGWVRVMKVVRMELGEPDESGRRRPLPVEGSEFEIETDVVVVAVGTSAHPLVLQTTKGLRLNRRGYIDAEAETGKTSREGVFAGGDIVTGSDTVISAMGAGKRAAAAIDEYLRSKKRREP